MKKFKNEYFLTKCLFVFSVMVAAVLLVSHTYNDILATTRHGINFWHFLYRGEIFDFFELNVCASGNDVYTVVQRCSYNILVYIVFAVWNMPLFLLEVFAGIDATNNIFCLVYSKLLIVAAMIISAIIVKKIVAFLGIEKKKQYFFAYLYLTSTLMISTVFITAQYDLFSVIFQLLGFYAFLRKKNKEFIFWFGIAFCFKYFSLVIFLPLLLLRYKKIFSWIKALVVMIIPLVLTKLPFVLFSANGGNTFASEQLSFRLGEQLLEYSFAAFNIFVIVYLCLLVWCYMQKGEVDESRVSFNAIWVCFVAFAAFFGLLNAYPYWAVFLAPFATLIILLAPKRVYISLILETFGLSALVLTNFIRYYWCYFGNTMKPMVMSYVVSESRLNYEGSIIYGLLQTAIDSSIALPVVNSVFIAAVCALAFITFPEKKLPVLTNWNTTKVDNDVLVLRFIITTGICVMPVLSLFV